MSKKIDDLVAKGKIEKVEFSKWASPCLPVRKKDGSYRLCIDVKRTLNPNLEISVHPLPRLDDIFATLNGGKVFVVLDLVDAYTQLKLDRPPQDLLVVNTHKGLYKYKNLVYGVASAWYFSADHGHNFTRYSQNVLLSRRHSLSRIVFGGLCTVLARLNKFNVKLRPDKCIWFSGSVEYLGHLISKDGRSPSPRLPQAMEQFKEPSNVKELRSFLGLLNFYASFLPNISTVLKPLRTLTAKSAVFNFSEECKSAFQEAEQSLLRSKSLGSLRPSERNGRSS